MRNRRSRRLKPFKAGTNQAFVSMESPVSKAHAITDAYMSKAASMGAAQGGPVRCVKGCFHCCREPLYVEKKEAEMLISTTAAEDMDQLKVRTRAWLVSFKAANLHRSRGPRAQQSRDALPKDFSHLLRYRAQMLWCPFLKDGICTAYSSRPIGCRTHAATGHPAKCENDAQRPKQIFLVTSTWPPEIMGAMADNAPGSLFEFDHLGVWLSILLLGETEQSAGAESFFVRQTEPW